MRFVLHYRGPLQANGKPSHKHELRASFHTQLKTLWSQIPLIGSGELLKPRANAGSYSLLREQFGFTFVPLVNAEMHAVADLSITLLRPEPPGGLITQGGDIDNRLKTLFDALTMPRHSNALPKGATPAPDQIPHFFCLFEDDNLVTSIAVRTEQLLEPVSDPSTVDLLINVSVKVLQRTWGNFAFG